MKITVITTASTAMTPVQLHVRQPVRRTLQFRLSENGSAGRYQDALALIKKNNPLPAVCGHICNRRCEDACTRGTIDQAIAIDEVKKFIAAQDLKAETRYIPEKVVPSVRGYFEEKIAIIGGGPAGLSCAFYLAEKGYKPTIFEKNERAGGMLVYGIPSFKLEKDVVQAEIDIIKEMGVEIRTGVEVGKDITLDELRAQGYKAFYIAIGCQGGRLPGIPNDTVKGCSSAVDLLKEVNANEKYDIKGDVVVIGGGNVAIDVARDSKRCGSDMVKVNMFCLESRETMPASVEEIEEAESEGIVVNPGWGPKEVLVDDNGEVRGIVLKKCLSVKDADGRFNPQYDENQLLTVECKHVFFSVGQSIVWGDLLKEAKWNLDAATERLQMRLLTRQQSRISSLEEMFTPDLNSQLMRSQPENRAQSPSIVLYSHIRALRSDVTEMISSS